MLPKSAARRAAPFPVVSPAPGTAVNCNGGPCPANSPQEFFVVNTPEPSSILMLLIGLIGLVGLARRRRGLVALTAAN
jgi:hypothetical protein